MNLRDDYSTGAGSPHRIMGVERSADDMAGCAAAGDGDEEPPRKRARAFSVGEDVRRRVLEYKLMRLKTLRERLTEQLCELYFLQAGGNMIDYAAWRKRPPAPALQAFLDARRPPDEPAAPACPPPSPAHSLAAAARAEAAVAARVQELARAGLWAERRLPRVVEPPRAKTHWDYLLEEMAWLAQDFAVERKWKKQAAKKCARAVQKHFQDKAMAVQRAEKAQEIQLRKIAAFAAREIRTFWSNVEKVVEWKRVRRVERARKEALDEQLSYIVDRSERYSRQLAANLTAPRHADTPPSDDESAPRDLPPSDYSADEDSADDETTIAEQERAQPPLDTEGELADLRADAELSLDELRAKYSTAPSSTPTDLDSDDDVDDSASADDSGRSSSASERLAALVDSEGAGAAGEGESSERRVEAAAQLAATLQPRGTTLAGAGEAGTPPPPLLRGTLREYQLVGLHWLATMHARGLNGILADEMGLGKTIQTIALLAHLACAGDWGPHLVVAPTSVVLNWEMEFKKWCPAFKILTYYGTIKERKQKRVGWTRANAFHVCITSYKLVVQDHQSFRRKRWQYLVLDEAQNIKNFKSQRWQMLLNFQTERRLLLTGTPLQNSLLELWSLMHFLMPAVFASHSEFREWFTPLAGAVAAGGGEDPALVRRLHAVLRPFLLRRLKADVERQMPRKYEHVLLCRLAKRQRALYDDFMSRAKTRETLASGNLLSVINVLMQLRKVCNHPDLFEPRPVASPLALPRLELATPALALIAEVATQGRLAARLGGDLASLEATGAGAFPAHRARHLAPPRRLLEEPPAPPRAPPPPARLRLHLRLVARTPHPSPARPPPPPLSAPPVLERPSHPASQCSAAAASASYMRLAARRRAALRRAAAVNERRCWRLPLYGADLRLAVSAPPPAPPAPLAPPTLEALLRTHRDAIEQFSVCWEAARAPCPELRVGRGVGGARAWRAALQRAGEVAPLLAPLLTLLHAPASRQSVAFPHPRLLQYDCGKLQTLSALLRRLRGGGHRVLIFTQMTRVLDVLEAFLSLHGHTYLRLDGATRVDRRQPLVDRFNADPRVFAFILSTRSGGVGLNLTGADSVVFYDSDWNPTMDAQAQDRCHRIGQTRDVHVYRLVTAATIEENILRKAEQKRALGHLAIEDGHFTTSYLRADTIAELLGAAPAPAPAPASLESALAAAEDEADAAAARAARAEAQRDLQEFDESVPLEEEPAPAAPAAPPPDPDDQELAALMKQLTPVEQYALRVVERGGADEEQAAIAEMRRQLHEWESARRRLRAATPPAAASPEPDLTYSGAEARTQVWVSDVDSERMPVWAPPTPPAAATDVYRESWARALYRPGAAPDRLLPPVPRAAPREPRRAPPRPPRPPHAPLSLFERGCGRRGARPRPHAPHHTPPPGEWAPHEDAALRRALRLQRLPPEPPPALSPNWEWCAELVAETARVYRGPRAARDRHDALADPERARRKQKKPPRARRRSDEPPPPPLARLEAMREAGERRRAAPKRRYDEPPANSTKHAALLADLGVDYDAPPTPLEVASRRADRIAKEKLKAGGAATPVSGAGGAAAAARIVVAGVAGGERRRAEGGAQLLYRQQALARQQLKILHHAQGSGTAETGSPAAAAGGAGAGSLRTLQLQQLALRRAPPTPAPAGPPAPRLPPPPRAAPHPAHVVVAHLQHAASAPAADHGDRQ